MTATVTVLNTVPLVDRVRLAREGDGILIFTGRTLEELHEFTLDAVEINRAFQERSGSIAEGRAALEREARVTRAWMVAAYIVAALSLALRSGGFLP